MENNIILLNRNKTVKVIKNEKKIFKNDCKYLLIPVLCAESNCFIMIKNKELLDFSYADISVTLRYYAFEPEDSLPFNRVDKRVSSITDLINFIHSIDRIDFVNYVMNFTVWDVGYEVRIEEFSITLYKDDVITYSLSLHGYDANSYNLMDRLEDLYETANRKFMMPKENDFLIIKNNKWELSNRIIPNSVVGLSLSPSQSIYFIESDEYKELYGLVKDVTYSGYVYNVKEMNELILDVDLFESEETTIEGYSYYELKGTLQGVTGVIELLIYLEYLYNVTLFSFNEILYSVEIYENKKYTGFDIYFSLEINLFNDDSIYENISYKSEKSSKYHIANIFNKILKR